MIFPYSWSLLLPSDHSYSTLLLNSGDSVLLQYHSRLVERTYLHSRYARLLAGYNDFVCARIDG